MIPMEDMTKWDVSNGMIVEFNNKNRGMVMGSKIFCPCSIINLITSSFSLNDFNDDLTNKFEEDLDIVKIYMVRETDKITLADVIRGVSETELIWDKYSKYKEEEGVIELMKTLSRDELQNVYQFGGNCKVGDIPEYILKSMDAMISACCPEEYGIKEVKSDNPHEECLGTCTECWYRSLHQ